MVRATAGSGGRPRGAWEEQAWRVRLLAAELGWSVDGEALLWCDVRDLLALRRWLELAVRGEAARRRFPWPGGLSRSRIAARVPGGAGGVLARAPRGRE